MCGGYFKKMARKFYKMFNFFFEKTIMFSSKLDFTIT